MILETLTMSILVPLGVLHQLLDDMEIEGYKFQKGLILLPNIYHCHYNKDIWTDPHIFRPERFLTNQGEMLKEHVVSFQKGKRQCVGEPLAKDIVFIFATKIFQLFDVSPDKCVEPINYYRPDVGFVLFPPKLGLHFKLGNE